MNRIAIVLSAAAVVLVTGVVHGLWTQRWYPAAAVEAAARRLDDAPTSVGVWTSTEVEPITPSELRAAGAAGCWQRRFTSTQTGQKLLVVILVGRTGQMCVHRPENCYPGQGYNLASGAPIRQRVKLPDGAGDADCYTARFAKPDLTTGGSQIRIFWTWHADGHWQAPDSPRWTFASQPYLYKMYVIRELPQRSERTDEDPIPEFLRQFLPELTQALAPE